MLLATDYSHEVLQIVASGEQKTLSHLNRKFIVKINWCDPFLCVRRMQKVQNKLTYETLTHTHTASSSINLDIHDHPSDCLIIHNCVITASECNMMPRSSSYRLLCETLGRILLLSVNWEFIATTTTHTHTARIGVESTPFDSTFDVIK